ncbi:MAG: carboxypeptidase regulatory-like domain-containing protein, partial [Acidobacteriaceae bacterium]|nr:carboxypeptidase regulatory-like domain-containing protein [Acidobacteriaceae bacterium]
MLLSLGSFYALAQSATSGTVEGEVTDQQGAKVAGADVRLTDRATNEELTTKSNDAGRYLFVNVKPSSYNITFMMHGFSTRKVDQQDVLVGQVLTINATLEVGQVSNVVEVTSVPGA